MCQQRFTDSAELLSLFARERFDQMLANAPCVVRRRGLKRGESLVSEDGEPASSVVSAKLSPDLSRLFEPGDGVGDPAWLGPRRGGKVTHSKGPVRCVVQEPKNLEVGAWHIDFSLQVPIELHVEPPRRSGKCSKQPLLVWIQPLKVRHGTLV